MTSYTPSWFASQVADSRRSAQIVVPMVFDLVGPTSVVDIGCGVGAWAAAFIAQGVGDVLGVDGEYVDRSQLLIPADRFVPRDVAQPLNLGRTFDLAVSLEVAEHLAPEAALRFVEELCTLAPTILFSAAIQGQIGNNHINERPLSYWVALFAARGYRPVDALRPAIWDDPRVSWWYRQNMLLLVADTSPARSLLGRPFPPIVDIVHPELFVRELRRSRRPLRTLCSDFYHAGRELAGRIFRS